MIKYPIFAVLLALFVSVAVYGDTGPKNIVLSFAEDAATTMTVSWQTEGTVTDASVSYSTLWSMQNAEQIDATCITLQDGTSQLSAELTDLSPNSVYYYTVESDGAVSEIGSFQTEAEDQDQVAFMFLGDIQLSSNGGTADEQYAKWGQLVQKGLDTNPNAAFVQTVGDMVEDGTSLSQWSSFLSNASSVLSSSSATNIPMMTCVGNHESNSPNYDGIPQKYLDIFSMPKNGPEDLEELFYSYDYGSVHVTVLNSHIYETSEWNLTEEQYNAVKTWIADDLASTDAAWKIVVLHHPVYAVASDSVSNRVKANWLPIFEEQGVDLILTGHQHVYARSLPMYNNKVDEENGITQIMGNSGLKFYSSADETWQAKTIYNASTYQIIDANTSTLSVKCYDGDGNLLDNWSTSNGTVVSDDPTVSFDVTPENASVTVYDRIGAEIKANTDGTYTLAPGTYNYRVRAGGYVTTRGKVDVGTSSVNIPVELTVSQNQIGQYQDLDTSSWYMNAVTYAVSQNLFAGDSATTFNPDSDITRAEFVTVLGKMDQVAISEYGGTSFTDVKDGEWYSPYIQWAVKYNIVAGVGGGKFDPEGAITREQAAVIFRQYTVYAKQNETAETSLRALDVFTDRGYISDWAEASMAWAVESGLFSGDGDGSLRPGDSIIRAEASSVFMSYLEGSILLVYAG